MITLIFQVWLGASVLGLGYLIIRDEIADWRRRR